MSRLDTIAWGIVTGAGVPIAERGASAGSIGAGIYQIVFPGGEGVDDDEMITRVTCREGGSSRVFSAISTSDEVKLIGAFDSVTGALVATEIFWAIGRLRLL